MKLKITIEGGPSISKNKIARAIDNFLCTIHAPENLNSCLIIKKGKITKANRIIAKDIDVVIICKCKKLKL